jgi:hypothetical protein
MLPIPNLHRSVSCVWFRFGDFHHKSFVVSGLLYMQPAMLTCRSTESKKPNANVLMFANFNRNILF